MYWLCNPFFSVGIFPVYLKAIEPKTFANDDFCHFNVSQKSRTPSKVDALPGNVIFN